MSDEHHEPEGRALKAAGAGNSQLYRELRYHNRQLAKTCGKQGQTIHQLRAELAEVRELNSKIDRGELRRAERMLPELRDRAAKQAVRAEEQERTILALEQKLADLDGGTPA